jgi:ribosomal protein L37E
MKKGGRCDKCGRMIYDLRYHLPRCPALGPAMNFDWGPTASKRLIVIADRDEKIRELEAEISHRKAACEYLTWLMTAWRCDKCGRMIYDLRDHLPRCPALGPGAR